MADTVAGLLRRHAEDPERVFAVLDDGVTITYAEQLRRSRETAAGLRRRGARPGDRVHVQLPNCPEFFDVWFATALSGTVLVPTGPQSSADELAHVLADAAPAVSIRDAAEADALRADIERDDGPDTDRYADAGDPGMVAAILYTSGTTSRAKGVMVTDANYVAVGRAVADHLNVTAADRWLIVLPLFHANAQYYCTMSALVTGASIALAPRFSAGGWGRQARTTGATLASLFAAPVRMILAAAPQPHDADNRLRAVLFAQNLSATDAGAFESRFGTRLLQLYGMTETVLPPTINPDDGTRRWDSIGRPLPGVTIDLVDENGATVEGPGTGEMRIVGRPGRTLAAGYWNNARATDDAFMDKGLRTGDLARRGDDGFLYFVDRNKDMIKRAGENVSAGEIERVANEHPAIVESAAVGVPDAIRDEAIVLVATVRPGHRLTADDLIGWCAERLSAFKVPGSVVFVDALPRTSVGKIRKADLRSLPELRIGSTGPPRRSS
ncbi:AMP-binding protein (plasmid) [Embleya sp. NBC_00888]|uniref:class I adenylate-forming enzyme family protein n=1 Tax=Embleya sp. NBC_00888 TaxID=2975960 RepID=UPI002F90ED07|nr:AMP-binding protein [Embleya sp. NBC_00888]